MSDQIQPEDSADPPRRRRSDEVREDLPDEDRPRSRNRDARDPDPEDRRPRRRRDEDEEDPERFRRRDPVESLIPYRNAMALASYYVGVFSLIPCAGLILGPVALVLGFLGLSYVKKHPTAGGTAHAIVGIVLSSLVLLGHLGMVVWFIVLVNMK